MEISFIQKYPEERHHFLKNKITEIVFETYVLPADSDYLIARFCGLNLLFQEYFWPASQAIEKYLKANLLLQGVSVKGRGFGHDIVSMASKLEKHDAVLTNLQLSPHALHAELQELNLWGSDDPFEFLENIKQYGAASNRYNYFGSGFSASFLPKLDQVFF